MHDAVSRLLLAGVLTLGLGLGACSRSELERTFAPDPRLQAQQDAPIGLNADPGTDPDEPPLPAAAPTADPEGRSAGDPDSDDEPLVLAKDFPRQAIPLYPERGALQWQEIGAEAGQVRWELATESDKALEFYAAALTEAGWNIDDTSPTGTLAAQQDPWQLEVKTSDRYLTLRYQALEVTTAEGASEDAKPDGPKPDPEDASSAPATEPPAPETVAIAADAFDDLETAPAPLQRSLQEVAALEILTPIAPKTSTFAPERPVTRRTFARWLLAAHERFWRDRPEWQIRPASATSEPLFADVPTADPDFISIQSLAMAGILPSALSGADGPKAFEPDAPLTRETLLAWKVPLDWHRGLPTATATDVRDTWGFQDADRIDLKNLAAIVADHNSGEFANLRRLFGYTQLLQPQQPVTRSEAAAALWFFGTDAATGRSAAQLLSELPEADNLSGAVDRGDADEAGDVDAAAEPE